MKKILAKINFNGIIKEIEIDEQTHTEWRVLDEMYAMTDEMRQSKRAALKKKNPGLDNTDLFIKMMSGAPEDALVDPKLDESIESHTKKFYDMLSVFVRKEFDVKGNLTFLDSLEPTHEEAARGVVMYHDCHDEQLTEMP